MENNKVKSKYVRKKKPTKFARFLGSYVAKVVWLIFVVLSIYFYTVFTSFPAFPKQWSYILIAVLAFFIIAFGLLIFMKKILNTGKILTMILNIFLCCALAFASWYLPRIRTRIEEAFAEVPTEGEAEINFYVLKDEYKNAELPTKENTEENIDENGESTEEIPETEQVDINFEDYKDKTFIIQKDTDIENQDYAMLVANRELLTEVNTIVVDTVFDGVKKLYEQEGDVLVLNVDYIPIVEDITEYQDFSSRVNTAYTVYKKLTVSENADAVKVTTEPFNILIVGNDKFGSVSTTGRTDVNIVASVNPTTKQIAFVTLPRDSYVPNACLYDHYDKLTHAGISGIKCTVSTIEGFLGISINYYVVINFSSLIKIVNAMGGIDINNPYKFSSTVLKTWQGTFKKGNIHLNGKQALVYVRERKNLTGGDFDRAKHQAIVIKALVDKITTPAMITKIDQILEALSGTFKTNLKMDDIYALAQMQLNDMAVWNMVNYSVTGSTGMDYVASLGSTNKYSVVYPYTSQITYVKKVIKQIKNGEIVEQGTLPKS